MITKIVYIDGVQLPITPVEIEEGIGGGEVEQLPSVSGGGSVFVSRKIGRNYLDFTIRLPNRSLLYLSRAGPNIGIGADISDRRVGGVRIFGIPSKNDWKTPRFGNETISGVGIDNPQRLIDIILDRHATGKPVEIEIVTLSQASGPAVTVRRRGQYRITSSSVLSRAAEPGIYATIRLGLTEYRAPTKLYADVSGQSVDDLSSVVVSVSSAPYPVRTTYGLSVGLSARGFGAVISGGADDIISRVADDGVAALVRADTWTSFFGKIGKNLIKTVGKWAWQAAKVAGVAAASALAPGLGTAGALAGITLIESVASAVMQTSFSAPRGRGADLNAETDLGYDPAIHTPYLTDIPDYDLPLQIGVYARRGA